MRIYQFIDAGRNIDVKVVTDGSDDHSRVHITETPRDLDDTIQGLGFDFVEGTTRDNGEFVTFATDNDLQLNIWDQGFPERMTIINGPDIAVTGVTVAPTTLTLAPAATGQLTATVQPTDATDQSVSWSSGTPATATVDSNGLVTAVATGTTVITVTTTDGSKTATCNVTVS